MTHNDLLNELQFETNQIQREVQIKEDENNNSTDTQATQFGLRSQRIDGGIVC